MYQLVLSEVNILLELQWWKTSVLAGITLQLELHKLRRPTQDDNETTVVNKNDTILYFVLAFCQEGGYLFDSYIPVRSCLSIAASVPWSLFLFRILLIGHCFWNIPIRNLRSVLFFFQRILTQWFLMPWARTEKVQVEAWNKKSCGHPATQQPLHIICWHDLGRLWFGIWFWHLSTSHVMK